MECYANELLSITWMTQNIEWNKPDQNVSYDCFYIKIKSRKIIYSDQRKIFLVDTTVKGAKLSLLEDWKCSSVIWKVLPQIRARIKIHWAKHLRSVVLLYIHYASKKILRIKWTILPINWTKWKTWWEEFLGKYNWGKPTWKNRKPEWTYHH